MASLADDSFNVSFETFLNMDCYLIKIICDCVNRVDICSAMNFTSSLFLCTVHVGRGAAVAQWLRCCATNRKVAGRSQLLSFFIDIKSFRSHYGPGIDSAPNRNEYQEHFLGVKAAGHVARMGEEKGLYRVLVGKPEGKRPLRRPRRRWVDNIRTDLQEVGCGYMDWIGPAQDRDSWRTLVRAVMNLRVP